MCNRPLLKLRTKKINPDTGNYELIWLSAETLSKPLDEITKMYGDDLIQIPCGKCEACKAKQKADIATRTYYTFKDNNNTYFITLTFASDARAKLAETNPKKYLKYNLFNIKLKEYLASFEHGETTGRPHYHLIISLTNEQAIELSNENKSSKYWRDGFVKILKATTETIFYTANYTTKKANNNDIIFFSKGLGKEKALKNITELKKTENIIINGKIYPLPRYFKKLIEKEETLEEKTTKQIKNSKIIKERQNLKRSMNDNTKADEIALKNYDEELKKERRNKNYRNVYL